ncbi:VTT domain-containing protein [Legionella spiritensis]|uniref:VTT domain-containing protein n=1 Tax=Legionella spiritensis TaxID=452 RepID=UPI000F7078C0|nr:VTT domain-containing protein [Legionella spiritensis]VEG90172.1 DedA/PAP2 domain protein [Legionella spiritensis]
MHLFSDYIQPVTLWLHTHPHWALFLTFIIAYTESLAIVGSIIPGSVTMTAIGILAGSGVMRIDLTLIASTLGAIAGDSTSYMIGYMFSDRMVNVWPFSRYPHWLRYGKEFFAKHGGKSVLIGRFVGPLRSIIPVIAGMMHMKHLHFYFANVVSAIAWSFLYVLPGFLIGAASNELSPETATRLFVLVLIILGAVWLATLVVKWLLLKLNAFLRTHLHDFWFWSSKHPHLSKWFTAITPRNETSHYATAGLLLSFLLCLSGFLVITLLTISHSFIADNVNLPIHFVLQSIRTDAFDAFFAAVSLFCSPIILVLLNIIVISLALYHRDWRTLYFWCGLMASCTLMLVATHWLITSPRPTDILNIKPGNSYPAITLTYATSIFTAILFYFNSHPATRFKILINLFFLISLVLAGFAAVYLGEYWLSDVLGAYLAGLSICLIFWLFYRRDQAEKIVPTSLVIVFATTFFAAGLISNFLNFNQVVHSHQPYFAQYVFTDQLWWNQKKPLLPIYRVNRFGRPISLFNIQYAGSISRLESSLRAFGWYKQNQSFYESILGRLSGRPDYQGLPLMAQLYLNRKPVLVMTYELENGSTRLILRLWRSNYHLKHYRQPVWIGSVHSGTPGNIEQHLVKQQHTAKKETHSSLFYVRMALSEFMLRELKLPVHDIGKIPLNVEPTLLLIKEIPGKELMNVSAVSLRDH